MPASKIPDPSPHVGSQHLGEPAATPIGIDEEPRPGSRGTTVAFLHPKTGFGTLIELVQP